MEALCKVRLGLTLDLIETWRDGAAQDAAKAAGASTKGAGGSWHNVTYANGAPASFAFHVDPFPGSHVLGYGPKVLAWATARKVEVELNPGGLADLTAAGLVLTAVGLMGEELGLVWGGRWPHLRDWLHFELHPNGATLAMVKAAMSAGQDIHVGPVTA